VVKRSAFATAASLSRPPCRARKHQARHGNKSPALIPGRIYGLHFQTPPVKTGLRHNGPNLVVALGTLIIARGPAMCSPLKGVGFSGLKPQGCASAGLLNQNPTWKVLVEGSAAAGSNPKIWLTRIVWRGAKIWPELSP
jgi:hypothetical protein